MVYSFRTNVPRFSGPFLTTWSSNDTVQLLVEHFEVHFYRILLYSESTLHKHAFKHILGPNLTGSLAVQIFSFTYFVAFNDVLDNFFFAKFLTIQKFLQIFPSNKL